MKKCEKNARGNTVERGSDFGGDRYRYDFKVLTPAKGWQQYDTSQDASYFGVWVNRKKRMTFTLCEGDTILVTCPTQASFEAELADMAKFYGPPPPMAVAIDHAGRRTAYYDESAAFGRGA